MLECGVLADDPERVRRISEITEAVWRGFVSLAGDSIRFNLRRNRVRKKLLPGNEDVDQLLTLGCSVRILDDVTGGEPPSKADL